MLTRLYLAIDEAGELLDKLHVLLPEQENSGPDTGTISGNAPASKEPWAVQAGGAYWDLYFGAREVARAMRAAAGLHLPVYDDSYGHDALRVIFNMAPTATEMILRGATRKLERLVRQGSSIPDVDEDEPWVDLPAAPGGRPIPCPYCETYGLRMLKRKGEVRCFFPGCTDGDGKPTRARMEPGRMTGEERLIFGDGTMMGGGHE